MLGAHGAVSAECRVRLVSRVRKTGLRPNYGRLVGENEEGGGVGFTLKIGGVFPQYMYLNGVFLCICVVL
jgi:hypothetical protein